MTTRSEGGRALVIRAVWCSVILMVCVAVWWGPLAAASVLVPTASRSGPTGGMSSPTTEAVTGLLREFVPVHPNEAGGHDPFAVTAPAATAPRVPAAGAPTTPTASTTSTMPGPLDLPFAAPAPGAEAFDPFAGAGGSGAHVEQVIEVEVPDHTVPTTEPPTSEPPTSEPPTTEPPTTGPPSTEAPTSQPSGSGEPTTVGLTTGGHDQAPGDTSSGLQVSTSGLPPTGISLRLLVIGVVLVDLGWLLLGIARFGRDRAGRNVRMRMSH